MASVDDYPFADFKLGSFDNVNSLGYPSNPELMSFGLFEGMEQNMAYLEEDMALSNVALSQLHTPYMAMPPQLVEQHPQHQQQIQHQSTYHNDLVYSQPSHHEAQLHQAQEQLQTPQTQQFVQTFDGFPPVHAFIPPQAAATPAQTHGFEFHTPQRSRQMSEPGLMETLQQLRGSPLSLSPESIVASSASQSSSTAPSTHEGMILGGSSFKRYKVIRGISSGGSATKPPRVVTLANHHYSPVNLELVGAALHDLCLPQWSEEEKNDRRRIIRVERYQIGSRIVAQFSIVGSANENPKTSPAPHGVDVVEVSCLECYTTYNDDDEDEDEESEHEYKYKREADINRSFYITSVEVIKVVELLIGTELQDAVERRRERGRIRSNLVPFWSKRPISSRMSNQDSRGSPLGNDGAADFRVELATRIMSYEIRKPRGFDKEVRILRWEKLVPALKRALQSYYVEVPDVLDEE